MVVILFDRGEEKRILCFLKMLYIYVVIFMVISVLKVFKLWFVYKKNGMEYYVI